MSCFCNHYHRWDGKRLFRLLALLLALAVATPVLLAEDSFLPRVGMLGEFTKKSLGGNCQV